MRKIDESLLKEITLNPQKKLNVLIVLEDGANPQSLNIKNFKQVMENIVSASLTPIQIKKLVKFKQIVFIEADSMMEAI